MDAYKFMMMDMDAVMGKVHTVAIEAETKRNSEERRKQLGREFSGMSLLDTFSSGQISRTRREVIRELIQAKAEEETWGIACLR